MMDLAEHTLEQPTGDVFAHLMADDDFTNDAALLFQLAITSWPQL